MHAFCKDCIAGVASECIKRGELAKLKCPATDNFDGKVENCQTQITETDLEKVGVSNDLILKLT